MFEIVKEAAHEEIDGVLNSIYNENPKFWHAGLSRRHFDGGLWMVREASTGKPAGFTGWQVREELDDRGLKKVGYYSIGILPAYRNQHWAKMAVNRMLLEKAGEVDVVRALIHPENVPSMALARSLGAEIEKSASKGGALWKALKSQLATTGASAAAGGVAVPLVNDLYLHPGKSWNPSAGEWDDKRIADFVTNALVGAVGGGSVRHGIKTRNAKMTTGGASTMLAAPYIKPTLARLPDLIDSKSKQLRTPPPANGGITGDQVLRGAGVGTGMLGLVLAGILGSKFLGSSNTRNAIENQKAKGRVKVTLPTKNPGDAETSIEQPIEDINLSNNILQGLGRDTRRRLRGENKERKGTFKREKKLVSNLGMTMKDDGTIDNAA